MSDITIRPMQPDEAPAVGAMTVAAYDASGQAITGPYREWLADPMRRVPRASQVLVAVDDATGQLLGTVTFVQAGDEEFEHPVDEGDAGFRILAVAPEAQGRGVGDRLIDACVTRAREAGAHRIVITSMSWMARAHGMYLRRGFVRRPDLDVSFPAGVGWIFSLDLSEEADARFGAPGPPREPLWFEQAWGREA